MMEEDENNKHSVYVEKYDKVYEEGQFAMNGDSLVICVTPDFDNTQLSAKFGAQMGYVTFICLGMISHKMSLITIFGHKHKIKNFIKKFYISHKKISLAFDFGLYLE